METNFLNAYQLEEFKKLYKANFFAYKFKKNRK